MDSKYFLLLSLDSDVFEAPDLKLYPFETYSDLWQFLQDTLFLESVRWYQIYWGDTLIMQRTLK